MLTSKELIQQAGISRATLNNYIALGILPKPVIRRSGPEGRAPRIGYFPPEAVSRLEDVERLKREGLSMANIAAKFRGEPLPEKEVSNAAPATGPFPDVMAAAAHERRRPSTELLVPSVQDRSLRVTVADIPGPAYMVNNNFEVVWWNEEASVKLFGLTVGLPGEIEARNIFRLLLMTETLRKVPGWQQILNFHLALAKRRLPRENLTRIYPSINSQDAQLLEQMFDSVEPIGKRPIVHQRAAVADARGEIAPYELFASFFREGILFVYSPGADDSETLLDLLSRREQVIRDLMKNRMPFLTNVGVLVADLQNSVQICAELPPEEYFALINHIWQASEPVFRKYYGTHGKHVGDGMVYYFFPQPDCSYVLNALHCAHELKEMMRAVSREWQGHKNWLNDLHLNVGLNEGQEWFGTYHSATNIEFTVLGDTINFAARLSDFARLGTIWATKSMLATLTPENRQRVRFGIRRRTERGDEVFVSNLYARISGMIDLNDGKYVKFRDIANLAVTEVIDMAEADGSIRQGGAPPGQSPVRNPVFHAPDYT